jgi:hypothetical protein
MSKESENLDPPRQKEENKLSPLQDQNSKIVTKEDEDIFQVSKREHRINSCLVPYIYDSNFCQDEFFEGKRENKFLLHSKYRLKFATCDIRAWLFPTDFPYNHLLYGPFSDMMLINFEEKILNRNNDDNSSGGFLIQRLLKNNKHELLYEAQVDEWLLTCIDITNLLQSTLHKTPFFSKISSCRRRFILFVTLVTVVNLHGKEQQHLYLSVWDCYAGSMFLPRKKVASFNSNVTLKLADIWLLGNDLLLSLPHCIGENFDEKAACLHTEKTGYQIFHLNDYLWNVCIESKYIDCTPLSKIEFSDFSFEYAPDFNSHSEVIGLMRTSAESTAKTEQVSPIYIVYSKLKNQGSVVCYDGEESRWNRELCTFTNKPQFIASGFSLVKDCEDHQEKTLFWFVLRHSSDTLYVWPLQDEKTATKNVIQSMNMSTLELKNCFVTGFDGNRLFLNDGRILIPHSMQFHSFIKTNTKDLRSSSVLSPFTSFSYETEPIFVENGFELTKSNSHSDSRTVTLDDQFIWFRVRNDTKPDPDENLDMLFETCIYSSLESYKTTRDLFVNFFLPEFENLSPGKGEYYLQRLLDAAYKLSSTPLLSDSIGNPELQSYADFLKKNDLLNSHSTEDSNDKPQHMTTSKIESVSYSDEDNEDINCIQLTKTTAEIRCWANYSSGYDRQYINPLSYPQLLDALISSSIAQEALAEKPLSAQNEEIIKVLRSQDLALQIDIDLTTLNNLYTKKISNLLEDSVDSQDFLLAWITAIDYEMTSFQYKLCYIFLVDVFQKRLSQWLSLWANEPFNCRYEPPPQAGSPFRYNSSLKSRELKAHKIVVDDAQYGLAPEDNKRRVLEGKTYFESSFIEKENVVMQYTTNATQKNSKWWIAFQK